MLYQAIPNGGTTITVVATGTALKTVLQVLTPSTVSIRVFGWGISFDGVTASAAPGICSLISVTGAATVTSLTPQAFGSGAAAVPASLCVGGTAATGFNASAEGSVSAQRWLDTALVHPQTGYSIWFPQDARPVVIPSKSLRIRTTFAATVNCVPWICWDEAA